MNEIKEIATVATKIEPATKANDVSRHFVDVRLELGRVSFESIKQLTITTDVDEDANGKFTMYSVFMEKSDGKNNQDRTR